MTPEPMTPNQLDELLTGYLDSLSQPPPDESVKESIISGSAAEAAMRSRRWIPGMSGAVTRFIPAIAAALLAIAGVATVLVQTVGDQPEIGAIATSTTTSPVATTEPAVTPTTDPTAPTTTEPTVTTTTRPTVTTTTTQPVTSTTRPTVTTTTTQPVTTTTTQPVTTTTTTVPKPLSKTGFENSTVPTTVPIAIPSPIPSVAAVPMCYGTLWMPGLAPGPTSAATVASATGLFISFDERQTAGVDEYTSFGVNSVSHPDAVLWVRVGDLHYRVTSHDLPWRVPRASGPIIEFGVCLGE